MRIDRCVCFEKSFATLHEIAQRTRARSLEELQLHVVFGKGCQLCHPYVRRMLQTGETVFTEIIN